MVFFACQGKWPAELYLKKIGTIRKKKVRSLVVFSWGYFCKDVFTQDICKCWGQDFFEKYLLTNERLKVYGKFACKVSMVP